MAWQFAGLTKFSPQEDSFCCELARDLPPHTEVLVYLPLYIGIRSIAIGLEKGAQMQPALPRKHRRTIAFYGTSINPEVVPPGRVWRIRPFCPGN